MGLVFSKHSGVYETSQTAIVSLKAYQMLIFMFINFFVVTVFDKKGVRFGVLLGCILTTIGLGL